MKNNSQSIEKSITSRIYGRGRGSVFSPNEFLDLGSRSSVDLALHRLNSRGTIRRLTRGLYFFPKTNKLVGELLPSVEAITKALVARDKVKIQPFGAYAANLLGLSEQVPAKIVFLTDGTAKRITVGKMTIELRPSSSRLMAPAGRTSGMVISALRYLGADHVGAREIKHLRRVLSLEDRKRLIHDLGSAPAWMHPTLRQIAAD